MATYKIDSSLLTAQANEIRTLNGTTATMNPSQMTTALQSANAEVAEQEALLVEIANTLQGKSVGGGGTSGSGSNIKTCTLTTGDHKCFIALATTYANGEFNGYAGGSHSGIEILENVVCGSLVYIYISVNGKSVTCTNCTEVKTFSEGVVVRINDNATTASVISESDEPA